MSTKKYWNDLPEYPHKTMYRDIAEAAAAEPAANAIDFYGKITTYENFLKNIDKASAAFAANGYTSDDIITLCLPNVPQALYAFYAIDRNGMTANMVHPLSAQSEITYYLDLTGSSCIITVDMFYEKVKAAVLEADHPVQILIVRIQEELPFPLSVLYVLKAGRPFLKYPDREKDKTWSEFLKAGTDKSLPAEAPFEKDRTSIILYSGGTSGKPKGICISDFNMGALAAQLYEVIPYISGVGLKMLSCMPIFHGFGLGINIHFVLTKNACCILMPTFNIKNYANILLKKKPNFIAGVPAIFEALISMPKMEGQNLDFLLGMFSGGDSLSVEQKKKIDLFLKEHGAKIQVQEGYGLTECVTASCLTPPDDYREGSIGVPFPNTKYAIVTPGTDDVLGPMQDGEIIISGPSVMLGYLNNKEETDKTLRVLSDGNIWLYTGDLGCMDEDGFVYFRQRIKHMIITNGYNVSPAQIEEALNKMPEVNSSCVIGIKDKRRGQRVAAFVIPSEKNYNEDELKSKIMEHLKKYVAGYALPKEIYFRDELPRTLVGKVAFRKLEEEMNALEDEKNE